MTTQTNPRAAILAATLLFASSWTHAADASLDTLPPPGPPRGFDVPAAHDKTLANGLRVVVINRSVTPLVSMALYLRSGAEVDPPQLAGLSDLTAGLLDKGTTTRTAPQIAEAADALGGSLGTGAGFDAAQVSITVTTPKVGAALDLLADVVRHPTFAQAEIDRERKRMLDDLRLALSQPGSVERLVAARAVFGSGTYGHSAGGTPASLPRIRRDDIAKLHDTYYRPDNAVLVFAGDIDLDRAVQAATHSFGDWKAPAAHLPKSPPAIGKDMLARTIIVDIPAPARPRSRSCTAASPATRRISMPGWSPMPCSGGSYSARLNEEIRIKRGLSYGAEVRSTRPPRRRRSAAARRPRTRRRSKSPACCSANSIASAARRFPPTNSPPQGDHERQFRLQPETTRGLLGEVANLAVYGLPLDELSHYLDRIRQVSAEQVARSPAPTSARMRRTLIVVGDAKQFTDALAKVYPKPERLSAAALDLDSATLKPSGK